MSQTYSISNEGVKLLDGWDSAMRAVERIKRELNSAECELANAQNALGKWMVPDGPDVMDEQFNIWVGDGFLSAKKVGQNDYNISWRKPQTVA